MDIYTHIYLQRDREGETQRAREREREREGEREKDRQRDRSTLCFFSSQLLAAAVGVNNRAGNLEPLRGISGLKFRINRAGLCVLGMIVV